MYRGELISASEVVGQEEARSFNHPATLAESVGGEIVSSRKTKSMVDLQTESQCSSQSFLYF